MSNDFASLDEDQIEEILNTEKKKYLRGMENARSLENVAPNDSILRGLITDDWNSEDWAAYTFYMEYIESRHNSDPNLPSSNPTDTGNAPLLSLSDALQEYLEANKCVWTPKSTAKFRQQLTVFVEMMENPNIGELNKESIRKKFVNRIHLLPKAISNKPQYFADPHKKSRKPLAEIFELAQHDNDERIGTTTIIDYAKNALSFLNWLHSVDYISFDTRLLFKPINRLSKNIEVNESAFTKEELKRLFETEELRTGSLMKKPEQHWSLLLGVYTGARENEICQLTVSDIRQDESSPPIWYIDINAKGEKQLKTQSSRRRIPIHKDLIKLGFLNYVSSQKNKNEIQLFSNLKRDKYGAWYRPVTRWFNGYETKHGRKLGYKEQCGIHFSEGKKKDFHSFRHTLIDHTKQNGLDRDKIREITGHAGQKDVHSRVYEKESRQ